MSIQNFLLFIMFPFIVLMAALILWFHLKTRSKRWTTSVDVKTLDQSISLDLTEQLIEDVKKRMKLMPFIFIGLPILISVFVMAILMLNESAEAAYKIGPIFLGLMFVGSGLGYLSRKHGISRTLKALELTENKKLLFQVNSEGINVPAVMLTNPAFWRATEKNLTSLLINWDEIENFEIWSGAGNAPAQYKIIPRGNISEFGMGRIGSANGPMFGICIKRKFLKTYETDILNLVHSKIEDRLILKTNL